MIRTLLILCIAGALSCGIGRPRLQGKWQVISETRIHDVAQRRLIAFFGRKGISLNFSRIEMTPDGGMNWRTVYLADENVALAGGAFFNDSNGIVVGTRDFSKPMILRTTDGGDNWETVSYVAGSTNQALDSQGLRAACNLSEGTTIILGETALIRATLTQTAMSAESVFSTSPNQLSQIACSGTDDAWAVGKSPVLFRLNSKGLTSINLPTDLIPNTVRFFDNRLWVVGSTTSKRGYLISSDDLGETWEDRTPSGSSALTDLGMSSGTGWLVGYSGRIYATGDGGETWNEYPSPTEVDLLEILSVNSDAWVVGDHMTLLSFMRSE
ncbi:MAG: hypothetical protein IPK58_07385 [Acidobacteria bacterium]|nr:hypothetical protein [Acidobacteriota bacterium]